MPSAVELALANARLYLQTVRVVVSTTLALQKSGWVYCKCVFSICGVSESYLLDVGASTDYASGAQLHLCADKSADC